MYDHREITDINFKLYELCKYQQSVIQKYEEYIKKYIHSEIKTEDLPDPKDPRDQVCYRRITIPQATIMLSCEPYVLREWQWLKHEHPLISPDYFIHMAYKEMQETKNASSN